MKESYLMKEACSPIRSRSEILGARTSTYELENRGRGNTIEPTALLPASQDEGPGQAKEVPDTRSLRESREPV